MSHHKAGIVSLRVAWRFAVCCAAALLSALACLPEEEARDAGGVGPYHGETNPDPVCGDSQPLVVEVDDAVTGRPVTGAFIEASANLGGGISIHDQDTSDATGIGGLLLHACDHYDVQVTCPGYVPALLHVECCDEAIIFVELTPDSGPNLATGATGPPSEPSSDPTCDYDWTGTATENNCPPSYNGTGDGCDCGCQFNDSDCSYTSPPPEPSSDPTCDYDWTGTDTENNCPPSWNGTGDGCDCGCQFSDPDCR